MINISSAKSETSVKFGCNLAEMSSKSLGKSALKAKMKKITNQKATEKPEMASASIRQEVAACAFTVSEDKVVAPESDNQTSATNKDTTMKKAKLVRDSFTIPKEEYAAIVMLKSRIAALYRPAKKSEILRAGLKVLASMSDEALRDAIQSVPAIKTGRPKSEKLENGDLAA